MSVQISASAPSFNLFESGITRDFAYSHLPYVYHVVDISFNIEVGNSTLNASFQLGVGERGDPYLSDEGGTSRALMTAWGIEDSHIEDSEHMSKLLEEVQEDCPDIETVEDLLAVREFIYSISPEISDFLDPFVYTNDPDDYEVVDEEERHVAPIALRTDFDELIKLDDAVLSDKDRGKASALKSVFIVRSKSNKLLAETLDEIEKQGLEVTLVNDSFYNEFIFAVHKNARVLIAEDVTNEAQKNRLISTSGHKQVRAI